MFSWWSLLSIYIFATSNSVSTCNCLNHILLGDKYEFVDLSFALDNSTVTFKNKEESPEWPVEMMMASKQSGTLLRAPSLYEEKGAVIGQISAKKLIVQLIIFDLSSQVKDNSSYTLGMKDLKSLLDKDLLHYLSSWPSLVIFNFGWSKYYSNHSKYFGKDEDKGTYTFPAVGDDVAEWLTKNESCKKIVGVGADLPYLHPSSKSSYVHKVLAKAGLYIIERLNLKRYLPDHKCTAVALPLKVNDASSVPLNIVAICPKDFISEKNTSDHNTEHRSKRHVCEHKKDKQIMETEHKEEQEMENEHKNCSTCSHHMHGKEHKEKKEINEVNSTIEENNKNSQESKPIKQGEVDKKPSGEGGTSETSVHENLKPQNLINTDGIHKIKDKFSIKQAN